MKITTKLTLTIALATLVIVILNIAVFYIYSNFVTQERIHAHLDSVSILKENELNSFVGEENDEIVVLSNEKDLVDSLQRLSQGSSAKQGIERSGLRAFLVSYMDINRDDFLELFIISPSGEVLLSTDQTQEGKIESETFFSEGKNGTYIQNFYYDLATNRPAMTISTPIKDSHGNLLGVLAGKVNLDRISDIMLERSGLGNTGETILVNQYNYLVSKARFLSGEEFKKALYTDAVKKCLKDRNNGFLTFTDYRGVKVVGVYNWIPERDVCLIAKMDYSEIMAPIYKLQKQIFALSFIIILIVILLVVFISKNISGPLIALRDITKRIGNGELETKINIRSGDELQDLAEAVSIMEGNLKAYQQTLLKEKTDESIVLEKEVDSKTEELRQKLKDLDDTQKAILNMMEDMKEANEHLKELDQAKSSFLNIVSHELKTPLTAIMAHLDVLDDLKADLNATSIHSFEAIRRNTNNLKMLIGNILEISRMESGKFELAKTKCDFGSLIEEVAVELDILSNQKGIAIMRDIGELPPINADETRMREVITNLLTNAIKFTEKGTITVKARKADSTIAVSVSDTGVGIPPDKIGNLFVKFYQVDPSISRRYGGTGLGLSITKQIITAHGGDIRVESEVGKGTTFSFNIPVGDVSSEESEVKK